MFHRPWQVWVSYLLALAVLLPGFAWLTLRALELDQAERLARAAAERDEKLSVALWRMDSLLMPIIAQEAARPHFVFEPSYVVVSESGQGTVRTPSPLLNQPSEFVLLNFQVCPDGTFVSPQAPSSEVQSWALENGLSPGMLGVNRSNLDNLRGMIAFESLLPELPLETLPQTLVANASQSPDETPFNPVSNTAQVAEQSQAPISRSRRPDSDNALAQQSVSLDDFSQRNEALQQLAQQQVRTQRGNSRIASPKSTVQEGVSRPLWMGEHLLLARRVTIDGETSIQGCWLNWDRLRETLLGEVADLLPEVALVPVTADAPAEPRHTLAALPVRLELPAVSLSAGPASPMKTALIAAWLGLLVAVVAIAVLLHGVTALSERRAAFVSAVTHELRTPLTTLQLYTEMLADGLLTDEAQRRDYINTLRSESDRLGHLVENVLGYARLERRPGAAHRQVLALGDLVERMQPRLERRAARAGMEIVVEGDARAALVWADPSVVEQIVFNLVDNACKYACRADNTRIIIHASKDDRGPRITVRDFGPGVAADVRRRMFQPFSKSAEQAAESAPGVGLGLALSRGLARQLGGELSLEASTGPGATFSLLLTSAT